jgi:hypothetical protein
MSYSIPPWAYFPISLSIESRQHRELWRSREWRCEAWSDGGGPQVRLYLGDQLVSDLTAGPRIDLQQQTEAW